MQSLLWVTADLNSSLCKIFKEKHFRASFKNSSFSQGPGLIQCLNCSTLQIGISWWYDIQPFPWTGFHPLPFGAACNWGSSTLHFGGLPGLGKGSADPCCYPCFFPCFSFCSRRLPLFAKDTIRWKVFLNNRYSLPFSAFCMSFSFLSQRNPSADGRAHRLLCIGCVLGICTHRKFCRTDADLTNEDFLLWHASAFWSSLLATASQNIYHKTSSTLDISFLKHTFKTKTSINLK